VRLVCHIMQGGQSYWFPQLIAVLSFSCSCLAAPPPARRSYYLPCFGSGLSLCLFTESSVLEVYFFSLPTFSRAGSVFHPPPLLSVFYYSSLSIFQFCRTIRFWMLLSGSRNQLCVHLFFIPLDSVSFLCQYHAVLLLWLCSII
jgi:hypothetical protein